MKPVFVDVDLDTYNASLNQIISKITKKTKIIMILHVLGTCGNIDKIKKIAKDKKIILIEDTCEALGAKFKKKTSVLLVILAPILFIILIKLPQVKVE